MSTGNARVFWIEAEPLMGGSGSQTECPLESAPFFGLPNSPVIGDQLMITLESAGVQFQPKKVDCHHNDVIRVNLPTARQGLGHYENSVLVFEKTNTIGVLRLTIVPLSLDLIRRLHGLSRRNRALKHTFRTDGSKRYYGYY
jgi:hypothetical protein